MRKDLEISSDVQNLRLIEKLIDELQFELDLSDEEKKEFAKLGKTIDAMNNPESVDVGKTEIRSMTMKEFQGWVEKEQEALAESPDPARAALLKRNIDAVKKQGKKHLNDKKYCGN